MNWKSLVTEDNDNASLGRLSFWMCFLIMFYFWVTKQSIDATLLTTFQTLLVYNVSKKIISTADIWLTTKK